MEIDVSQTLFIDLESLRPILHCFFSPILFLDWKLRLLLENRWILWGVINLIIWFDDRLNPLLTSIQPSDSESSDLHSSLALRNIAIKGSTFALLSSLDVFYWSDLLLLQIHQCLSLPRSGPFSKLLDYLVPSWACLWSICLSYWIVLIEMSCSVLNVRCVEGVRISAYPLIREEALSWSIFSHSRSVFKNLIDSRANWILPICHRRRENFSHISRASTVCQCFWMSPIISDQFPLQFLFH